MAAVPKILLVTMTPPGEANVGEIILRDLCGLIPSESIALFTLSPARPKYQYHYPTDFSQAPGRIGWRPFGGRAGSIYGHLYFRFSILKKIERIADQIADFGRRFQADIVWMVLNSIPMICLGNKVAIRLGIPQVSLVWDPPDWQARQCRMDRFSRKLVQNCFGQALSISRRIAVVSQEMKEEYERSYGPDCVILRHALTDGKPVQEEPQHQNADGRTIRIGFAGTLYDTSQLNILLQALHLCNWKIEGKPVVLRMIGNWFRFNGMFFPCNVELLGWRSTHDSHRLLSECDINYLPISFSPDWEDFARLSFPTKLSTYLATGKPVFVHGPGYSSSVKFCRDTGIGICVASQDPKKMVIDLQSFFQNTAAYGQAIESVDRARVNYFSVKEMKTRFFEFIGIDPDSIGCDS